MKNARTIFVLFIAFCYALISVFFSHHIPKQFIGTILCLPIFWFVGVFNSLLVPLGRISITILVKTLKWNRIQCSLLYFTIYFLGLFGGIIITYGFQINDWFYDYWPRVPVQECPCPVSVRNPENEESEAEIGQKSHEDVESVAAKKE